MSQLSTQRAAILAALASVPGLAPTPSPGVVVAGSAWPAWRDLTWLTSCKQEIVWYVFVALPAGTQETTIDAGDELLDAVAAALQTIGYLATVEPYQWMAEPGGQPIPVLRFTLEAC